MKFKSTPTHQRGEHNVSGTTQASFLPKFKATCNKLGHKRHRHSVPKTLCPLPYIIKHRLNKLKQLLSKIQHMSP